MEGSILRAMTTQRNHPFARELDIALEVARNAADIVVKHYDAGAKGWEKSKDNPVTEADLEADRAIRAALHQAFPDDALLSEETVDDLSRVKKSRVWIIDPMDGTKEFINRIPEFAVSIGLVEDGEPVVGVIVNPVTKVAIWAARGNGTYKDGEPVQVAHCDSLQDAVVIASRTEISRKRFEPCEGWFKEIRPVGSIAWKLACIAAGDGHLNISFAPKNEWDVCAGDILVREAGGVYVDIDGERRIYNQAKTLISAGMSAGAPELIDALCKRLATLPAENPS